MRVPAQVISGGHYDVDCYVEDPNGKTIYQETKKQYDSFTHRTELKGVYTFCFGNEFSTFSHKIVYFDFQVGDEPPILPDMNNRVTALTQVGPGREGGREGPAAAPSSPAGWQLGPCPHPPPLDAEVPTASQQPQHSQHHILCLAGGAGLGLGSPIPLSIPREGIASAIPSLAVSLWAGHLGALVGISALSHWEPPWMGSDREPTTQTLLSCSCESWHSPGLPQLGHVRTDRALLSLFPSWNPPVSPSMRC